MSDSPLKPAAAALALGISRATIYRMISDGRLAAFEPVPGQLRIEPAEIDRVKQETRRRPRATEEGPMLQPPRRVSTERDSSGSLREQLTAIRGGQAA